MKTSLADLQIEQTRSGASNTLVEFMLHAGKGVRTDLKESAIPSHRHEWRIDLAVDRKPHKVLVARYDGPRTSATLLLFSLKTET